MWTLECDGPILESEILFILLLARASKLIFTQTSEYGYVRENVISLEEPHHQREDWVRGFLSLKDLPLLTGVVGGFVVDEKSVSRQHLTLSVSRVKPGDGVRDPVTIETQGDHC